MVPYALYPNDTWMKSRTNLEVDFSDLDGIVLVMETLELEFGGVGKEDSRLVKAAVWSRGIVYLGWRHSQVFQHLIDMKEPSRFWEDPANHGFVDQYNLYYTRQQAAVIAFRAKQTKVNREILFSEDLWELDGTPRDGGLYDPLGDGKWQKKLDAEKKNP